MLRKLRRAGRAHFSPPRFHRAAGSFTAAGGVPANNMARWDDTTWSALGSATDGWVYALALDASGILYAAGEFATAGGVPAYHIARWSGSAWSALGSGMGGEDYPRVRTLAADGSGSLYAGGDFTTAGGKPSNYMAR